MLKDKKIVLIGIIVFGLVLLIFDYQRTRGAFDGKLERNEPGKGVVSQDLELEFLGQKSEITVEVSDKALSEKEIERAFDKVIKEIEETYLGNNKSADKVSDNLVLNSTYSKGIVSAEWTFDKYGFIDSDGVINLDKVSKEGELINISARLFYEEHERIYSFSVVLVPKGLDTLEGQLNAVTEAVENADKNTRGKDQLVLPDAVENIDIVWKKKMDYRGLQIIILGVLCVAGISLGRRRDEKLEKERWLKEMDYDYPIIVGQLSILMGAGMSFRKALERIVASKDEKRAGFEQMQKLFRRMNDGLSELQAIEELGMKCENKEYRKLAMMLGQNLRKGSKDLLDCLEKEQRSAFEARKQRAIRAGEEASTKLLIPMSGMLFIVIVILVVPAVMQINI